jgi:hypothetical protein
MLDAFYLEIFAFCLNFLFMVRLKLAHKVHRSCLSHLVPGGQDSSESISDVLFSSRRWNRS